MIQIDTLITGIEIGVWEGANAVNILTACPLLTLVGVDPYEAYQDWWGEIDRDEIKSRYDRMIAAVAPYGERFRLLKQRSDYALSAIVGQQFDLIYIDGDHSYKWAYHDMQAYWPKVTPGGVLCGHDRNLSGVLEALKVFQCETGAHSLPTEWPQADSWYITKE